MNQMNYSSGCTRIAFGNKSNFKRRLLDICGLFILMCVTGLAGAQESDHQWSVYGLTGTFNTQRDAEVAIQTSGGDAAYLRVVKRQEMTEHELETVYWMGIAPSALQSWVYAGLGVNVNSEEAVIAQLTANANASVISKGCSTDATSVTQVGTWTTSGTWPDGVVQVERALYEVLARGTPVVGPNCTILTSYDHVFRSRERCANPSMRWFSTEQVCKNESSLYTATATSTPVTCDTCSLVGNPSDVTTGNKYQPEADFDLGWISFMRYYHSAATNPGGGFAYGWTHSQNIRIAVSTAGRASGLVQANGAHIPFKEIATNLYEATTGTGDRIVKDASGTFTLYQQNKTMAFDTAGRITSQTFEDGTYLTYTYNNFDRLIKITHSTGRSLDFNYDATAPLGVSRIASISTHGLPVASYVYTTSGQLDSVTYPSTPVAVTRIYHYEDARFPFNLTGITSETGLRFSTYGYDAKGRVISSEHAGGVDKTTLAYNVNGGAIAKQATGREANYSITASTGGYGSKPRKVTDVVDSAGTTARTYYAEFGDFRRRLDVMTDSKGIATKHEYTETTDIVTGFPVSVHKIMSAFGLPEQKTTEEHRSIADNRLLLSKVDGQETRVTRNTRLQPVTVATKDIATGVTRTINYVYCEANDVGTTNSTCPRLGLLKTIDGPRTDLNDITNFSYYSADATTTCDTAPATCPYRKGDLWKVTNALNQSVEYTAYDGAGRVLQMKDINSVITDMEYNARGWLTARKVRGLDNTGEFYDDAINRMEYDANGQITKVMGADGYSLSDYINFTYDAAHRLTDISDPQGNSIHYTLDNAGNRIKQDTKDANGTLTRSMSSVYDTLGRLQFSKNAGSAIAPSAIVASFSYDAGNNVDKVTDALGRISDQDVDPLNRLKTSIQDFGVGQVNATTQFEYDACDNLTKVIDPKSLSTAYTYNGLNELTNLISPDTGVTAYTYDSAGNRKTQKDAKDITTTYTYDALNRLTQVAYPTSTLNSDFFYDTANAICGATENFAQGRLTKFTDPSGSSTVKGSTEYCYDRFGNMTRKQISNNGTTSTFVFTYTRAGRLLSTTYPSGMKVAYGRNNANQVTEVLVTKGGVTKIFANNITYYPFGPLSRIEFLPPNSPNANPAVARPSASSSTGRISPAAATGGGCIPRLGGGCNPPPVTTPIVQTRVYDLDYAIKSVGGLNYTVDNQGNIKSITDAAGGNDFDYDTLDRLKQVKIAGPQTNVESYTYDETGNRLSKTTQTFPSASYSYPNANHQLATTSSGGFVRVYDLNGNMTQSASDKYFTYDERNRMVDFRTSASAIDTQYQYNAKGERVRKYGSGSQEYSYDESGKLLRHKKAFVDQEIIWLDDMPIGVSQGGELYGILSDHLNTPRQAFSIATQQTKWRWDAVDNAFGEKAAVSSGLQLDLRFPGQMFDAESGLHYNYYRDYEPGTGRYVESDPIGLRGGVTTYSYVDGAPMTGYDTTGLFNPNKLTTSLLSALNSLRLGLAGGVTTIASVFAGGMGSEEVGGLLMGKAIWNFRSSSVAMKKSLQFGCEASNQDVSQMSFKNFLGLVPFGQNFDDINEPGPWEWLKSEAQDKGWVEWVEELGTAGT